MTEPLYEKLRVRGLSDDEERTLNLLAEQLNGKLKRNNLRSAYYDGRHAVKSVGGVIPPQYENLAITLGWAAKGVDGLARRCNLEKMIWTGGDLAALGMQELEDRNFLRSEISQGRTDSLLHGVSFLITTRGDESAGEPAALVHAKDGRNATGEWNTRTRALDSLLSVTAWTDGRITGFVLYLPDLTISANKTGGRWSVDRSEHTFGVPADPLVYKPRASRRMGHSRITRPVMKAQDAAVRALIRLEAHMDIYAIPKLMLLGASDEMFKNSDGSMKTSWQMIMGRVLGIPDDEDPQNQNPRADIKTVSAESPKPHLDQLNAQAKIMARETDLPDADFAIADMVNPTSADSYTASRENLIAEAEGAMDDWSPSIRRTVNRALAIQNGLSSVPDAWAGIQPKWRSPIYLSRAQAADAGSKQLGSVPWLADTEVGLELIGLDEQQIQRAMAAKQREAGRALVASLAQRNAATPPPANAVGA